MAVDEIQRAQAEGIPHVDLRQYAGLWVALRGSEIVATDIDPVALKQHPEVEPTDALLPVPDTGADILIL